MSGSLLAVLLAAAPAVAHEFTAEMPDARRAMTRARMMSAKHAQRPAGAASRPVEDLLSELDEADPMVRLLAIQQLRPHVKANLSVRGRIKSCLADSEVEIRALSMVVLGDAAAEDDSLRLAIQELFLKDDDDAIKLSGMEILWPRLPADAAIRARILEILRTPIRGIDDLFVVDQAVISVMNAAVIGKDAEIKAAVLRILAYDDSWFASGGLISSTAAATLKPLCRAPEIRTALEAAAARKVGGAIDALAECAEAQRVCDGFLPPNNLRIPIGDVNALGIDEAAFDAVLTRVESIYAPILAAKGKKLRVNRKWPDDTVNAGAMQFNDTWVINMYGGLARHKAVTAEGFALVACHEIGHHIGGFPKTDAMWPTNEGGSDYFATLKCLRRVFTGNEDTSKLNPVAVKACAAAHAAATDRKFCEAGALAGQSIAALFQNLRGQTAPPSFSTPDPTVVAKTNDAHPDTQCRLDTYYAGALCAKPLDEEQVDGAPAAGACTAAQGFAVGLRPKCWYKAPAGQAKAVDGILDATARSLTGRGF